MKPLPMLQAAFGLIVTTALLAPAKGQNYTQTTYTPGYRQVYIKTGPIDPEQLQANIERTDAEARLAKAQTLQTVMQTAIMMQQAQDQQKKEQAQQQQSKIEDPQVTFDRIKRGYYQQKQLRAEEESRYQLKQQQLKRDSETLKQFRDEVDLQNKQIDKEYKKKLGFEENEIKDESPVENLYVCIKEFQVDDRLFIKGQEIKARRGSDGYLRYNYGTNYYVVPPQNIKKVGP